MNTYTVFCQSHTGGGTIWISAVKASDVEDAKIIGRANCADDWEYANVSRVVVLGVAEGDVNILFWEDQE